MQGAEHPQKDFLRQVERLFAISQQVGGEPEHQAMVLENEGGMGGVVARQAPLDERSFAAGDLGRPPDGSGRLSGKISCQVGPSPEYSRFFSTLDPGNPGLFESYLRPFSATIRGE